jgi:hypothetical protein
MFQLTGPSPRSACRGEHSTMISDDEIEKLALDLESDRVAERLELGT